MTTKKRFVASLAGALESYAKHIMSLAGWRRYGVAFLSGAATALALAPIYALPLMALGFSTLVLLLDASRNQSRPRRSAFAMGWFFGFGYFLFGIYWMAFSFFVQADQFAWMAPFAVSGLPAFLALFTGAATLAASLFNMRGAPRILIFAAMWAIAEYARGHLLTGLPWNLAGQAFAGAPIAAQTAAWYGAYGLSLAAVLVSSAPSAWVAARLSPLKALMGPALALTGVGALFLLGAIRLAVLEPSEATSAWVRIVQPNIPQREKIDPDFWGRNFYRSLELSKETAPSEGPLFILWPENAAPLLNEAETALSILSEELPENAVLVSGAVRRERRSDGADRFYNSIVTIVETPEGRRPIAYYDKHHLVPFGEYLPFYDALNALGLAQLTPYGDAGFASGDGPRTIRAAGASFSPLVCYEAIFPGAVYDKSDRPEWLLTVTNDAWFGDTSGPRQHLDQARLRAIETGLPMARSANTGISALIDANGRILARVKLYEAGVIEAPLPHPLARPLYDRIGDWAFWAMIFALIGVAKLRALPPEAGFNGRLQPLRDDKNPL